MIDAKLLLSFTATTNAADKEYLIKLINTFDSERQEDIFRTMHDPNHRHPRHRGTHLIHIATVIGLLCFFFWFVVVIFEAVRKS